MPGFSFRFGHDPVKQSKIGGTTFRFGMFSVGRGRYYFSGRWLFLFNGGGGGKSRGEKWWGRGGIVVDESGGGENLNTG